MYPTDVRRPSGLRLLASGFLAALLLAALAGAANAGGTQLGSAAVPCPVTATELSGIVGKTLQRVNLSDPARDPAAQCAFSLVSKVSSNRFVSPQVFLTVGPGGVGDLRSLYQYYVQSRSKLATRPRVTARPDLGAGAFTLTAATTPVTTAFFLVGKNVVGTLAVDLAGAAAGKRDQATAEKILALVYGRLH